MSVLTTGDGSRLAYDLDPGTRDPAVGVVFLHGFGSIRSGDKARALRARCRELGVSFLAGDARAHGDSSGTMRDLTLTGYIADVVALLNGPGAAFTRIVLVGSSLGGAAALFLAARNAGGGRIRGVAAIAPALGFATRFLALLTPDQRRAWETDQVRRVRNEWLETDLGWNFIADGLQFNADELHSSLVNTPVLLIHGAADDTVPVAISTDFAARHRHGNVTCVIYPDGDHRLLVHKDELADQLAAFIVRVAAPA